MKKIMKFTLGLLLLMLPVTGFPADFSGKLGPGYAARRDVEYCRKESSRYPGDG